jgi:ABC-type branched-subunit amino acid transport system ATPase component/ABC-type branched-subunit amino acid transport system permease subunit
LKKSERDEPLKSGQEKLRRLLPIILFFLLLFLPVIVSNPYYLSIVSLIGIYSILISGLNLAAGYAGLFSMGHAGFFAIGAYTAGILSAKLGFSLWVNLPLSCISSIIIGGLLGIPSLRFKGFYYVISTMALGIIIKMLIGEMTPLTGGSEGISNISRPSIGSYTFSETSYYYIILVVLFLGILFCHRIVNSKFNRQMVALRENEIAAETMGINVYKSKLLFFIISTAFAGIAGCLYAHLFGVVNPDTFDMDLSFLFLLMVLLGGRDSLYGSYIGVIFLSIFPLFFMEFVRIHLIIYGLLFVAFVYAIPDGIMGVLRNIKGVNRYLLNQKKILRLREKKTEERISIESILTREKENAKEGIPLLCIENLSRSFSGIQALQKVNLTIQSGTIHGLIGPNGSGKSTLLNLISGVYQCEGGKIFFNGEPIDNLKPHEISKKGIARTFQKSNLYNSLTVLENVSVGQDIRLQYSFIDALFNQAKKKRLERQIQERSLVILEFLGVSHLADRLIENISPMECRIVEIARALASQPKLLLLDEPATGFTKKDIEELNRILKIIRKMGVTILLIEHHIRFIMDLADYITVLNFGENIFQGPPLEVATNPKVIEAYLGEEMRI